MMKGSIKKVLTISLMTALSSYVYASGYKLEFESPSYLADSGDAAVVQDAGTNWYNSAGLVYLPQQLAVSATYLYYPVVFHGSTTAPSIVLPGVDTFVGNGRASSYNNVLLPAIHYSMPVNDCTALGLSVVPAWGLLEDYGEKSILRYDLVRIYTRSIDISPSIAYRYGNFSIGIGPDAHYWYLSSKTHVRTQPFTLADSISRFSTHDWGYGGHVGLLYNWDDCTRIGFNYRSQIVMDMNGYSDFALTGIDSFETGNFRFKVALPPSYALSAYHAFDPCWAIMGTITYDKWDTIRDLHGIAFVGPLGGTVSVVVPTNYRNAFNYALGGHYKLNDQWLFRASVKYEDTPTINATRDVNFPDESKVGLNFGARFQMNKKMAIDLLYAHVFIRNAPINFTNVFGANTNGHASSSADIAGAQVLFNIC